MEGIRNRNTPHGGDPQPKHTMWQGPHTCSSTGSRTTSLLTSLWRMVDGQISKLWFLLNCLLVTGQLWHVLTFTSRTTPFASGQASTTRPSLNWPLSAFWSANHTRSPAAMFLAGSCHFWRTKRPGPAS